MAFATPSPRASARRARRGHARRLRGGAPSGWLEDSAAAVLDRLASFGSEPAGTALAGRPLWRAIPSPVSDALFGEVLGELLREYDVGVYVPPEPGGGFGQQVALHLAAGQLLLADTLTPAHGLERNIDYLHVEASRVFARIVHDLLVADVATFGPAH